MIQLKDMPAAAIFDGLTDNELRLLAEIAQPRVVTEGERLVTRGGDATTLVVPSEGRFALAVVLFAAGREEETIIETFGPGQSFGWSSLVAPFRSIYSVYAASSGRVIELHRPALTSLFVADTGLGYRFMCNLTELIGRRTRLARQLWIDEVEQSMSRVNYWMEKKVEY